MDKIRTLYTRFRKAYEDMQSHGYGLDKDFVVISRQSWDRSQRTYEEFLQAKKAVYGQGRVN